MRARQPPLTIVYPDISGLALVQVEVGIIPWKMNGLLDAKGKFLSVNGESMPHL